MKIPSFFTPSRGMDALDLSKGVGETSDAFKSGSNIDKGFASVKLANSVLGLIPAFNLPSSIIGMNLNVADNVRNPSVGGIVDLAFDTAKIVTSFHPVANLGVRGTEVLKNSFVYCAQHPKEFAEFNRQTRLLD